jgi:hypothetical protein
MSVINESGVSGQSRNLRAISLLILAVCGVASGCRGSQTVWSAEAKSPNGEMIATARGLANGGFGISGVPSTFVYLNWTTGSQQPTEILCLDDESDSPDDMNVRMKWLSPTHLELTYKSSRQSINFQAVKFVGVDISLRDTPSEAVKPTQ